MKSLIMILSVLSLTGPANAVLLVGKPEYSPDPAYLIFQSENSVYQLKQSELTPHQRDALMKSKPVDISASTIQHLWVVSPQSELSLPVLENSAKFRNNQIDITGEALFSFRGLITLKVNDYIYEFSDSSQVQQQGQITFSKPLSELKNVWKVPTDEATGVALADAITLRENSAEITGTMRHSFDAEVLTIESEDMFFVLNRNEVTSESRYKLDEPGSRATLKVSRRGLQSISGGASSPEPLVRLPSSVR